MNANPLTSHMITSRILLNIRSTLPIRTLPRRLPNLPLTFLLLVSGLAPTNPILKLRARFALMPFLVVCHADAEAAVVAFEDWAVGAQDVDLSPGAEGGETPPEIGHEGEGGAEEVGGVSM